MSPSPFGKDADDDSISRGVLDIVFIVGQFDQ
jgi:hypothetical protein